MCATICGKYVLNQLFNVLDAKLEGRSFCFFDICALARKSIPTFGPML